MGKNIAGRFAVVTVVNFILVFLAAMLFYPHSAPMDEAVFAAMDDRYDGCTIVSSVAEQEMTYYLVRTRDGETDLIPTKVNSFVSTKWKICKSDILTVEDPEAEQTLTPTIGMQSNTVVLSGGQIQSVRSGLLIQIQADSIFYLAIAIVLAATELWLFDKLTGQNGEFL